MSDETEPRFKVRSILFIAFVFVVLMAWVLWGIWILGGRSETKEPNLELFAKVIPQKNFNHNTTTFPLLGAHRRLECSECHLSGRFESLPRGCSECHSGRISYGKPVNHVQTKQECSLCHLQTAWFPAVFRHDLSTATG